MDLYCRKPMFKLRNNYHLHVHVSGSDGLWGESQPLHLTNRRKPQKFNLFLTQYEVFIINFPRTTLTPPKPSPGPDQLKNSLKSHFISPLNYSRKFVCQPFLEAVFLYPSVCSHQLLIPSILNLIRAHHDDGHEPPLFIHITLILQWNSFTASAVKFH